MSPDRNALAMAGLLLGLMGGFIVCMAVAAFVYRRRSGLPLFLEEKRHDSPWGPTTMIGALILQVGGVVVLTQTLMKTQGPDASMRDRLLAHSVASVAVLGFVVAVLRARPQDFGVVSRGFGRTVLQGAAACALALPVVYGVQVIAIQVWHPQSHPVEQAIVANPTGLTALIAAIGAVIVAPIVEEIVFRGIVLGSLWKAMSPGSRGLDFGANVVASLLFAGMHAAQWPAPIPLFALSLGLGEVYRRSGSLVAPIVMHACFNGLSTASLLIVAGLGIRPG